MSEEKWLVWMWRYMSLNIHECDSLSEAIGLASAFQDNGDGALESIEGPDGVVDESVIEEHQKRLWAAERERISERPTPTHHISARSPKGEWARVGSLPEDAEEVAHYQRLLGPDRVRVEPF